MKVDLQKIVSVMDLTSLKETDTAETISILCNTAITEYGYVAGVCTYPRFVKQVAKFFHNKPVKVVAVANFPHGNESWETVEETIRESIKNGAQEIDVVFPYADYLAGEKLSACDFIRKCKAICGETVLLKVILETGALKDLDMITAVSQEVLLAGADFLKTSTGKIAVGATPEAVTAMLRVVKEMSLEIKRPLGVKVSGGVRTVEQAVQYMEITQNIMGLDWINPVHFRLGASQLLV